MELVKLPFARLTPDLRQRLPHTARVAISLGRRAWTGRRHYDATKYWKSRARDDGQASVLWLNETYNEVYRERQRELLADFVKPLMQGSHVLDIGCGIGIVARMLVEINPQIEVDAVDFAEMVERAKTENGAAGIRYIASSAEAYRPDDRQYDLIVSSGCYSAIRDLAAMQRAFENAAAMTARGGRILMIDPFHRNRWMSRAWFSSRQVSATFRRLGFRQYLRSGVLFWPYREWLANSPYSSDVIRRRFAAGERWLRRLGQHAWADYKVLVFEKN